MNYFETLAIDQAYCYFDSKTSDSYNLVMEKDLSGTSIPLIYFPGNNFPEELKQNIISFRPILDGTINFHFSGTNNTGLFPRYEITDSLGNVINSGRFETNGSSTIANVKFNKNTLYIIKAWLYTIDKGKEGELLLDNVRIYTNIITKGEKYIAFERAKNGI